ncbi:hypothetical protein [Ktedonospora formicarum]|uniref:hypothetical protein n=1 Tax=Ktedonospora formicarum TaxID=2778364 RepID=UPI001C6917D4|nr:hypothetical protein [Ktedonospora formicarum]
MSQTILLIDGENTASRLTHHIVPKALQFGDMLYKGVFGCTQALASWQTASLGYHLDTQEILSRWHCATERGSPEYPVCGLGLLRAGDQMHLLGNTRWWFRAMRVSPTCLWLLCHRDWSMSINQAQKGLLTL